MGIEEKKSIIHRKAKGGRDEFDARVMSPVKALRLALAKVADKMFGLAVTVTTVEQVKLPHKAVQAEVGNDGLLLLLDGAAGARGAAKVDTQFLTALIEVQTTGTVRRSAGDARPVTRTDAAIVAPLLDAVMRRYDAQLTEADPKHVEENYRFGDMIEEARLLSLALEAPDYDLYRLTLDVEDGAKTGILKLLLPHRKVVPAKEIKSNLHRDGAVCLEKSALEAQVAMDAVLSRIRLPLKEICEFAPGMLLPLDAECLAKARLVASGGHVVARVRMGQMNGMRAVRFIAPASTDKSKPPEKPDEKHPQLSKDSGMAPIPALQDDVLEGLAQPVPDLQMAEDASADLSKDAPPLEMVPAIGKAASDDPEADASDELSTADLMLAAAALQNHSEDA
ncbi:FliM/FliN family flagellar motor switch protein [uncultured Roseovarius sp.]|uniref:FliM/FliN family flagellar motor switch protein n=1 Tax=uncultured Roseovarius sp. TaxID=293344 RepID=UPI00261DFCD1|nr:FliM/FliN family flagellar motor switch protein [uncultured Roseovarius sp.]